ncbi:hypothetical protein KMW28_15840 [Flammeovirga yaeyamensis]|uniref:Uncharacterized protein n=1 Tax=Flammeovirga yaeyamensis TaxID=367791 RepID=A0AAX1N4Z7_9BACT|nr:MULTISPECIES: hypothetical protein [Flammeovirga]ANQ47479.1 hypothetical protein MY04_0096 [Flammeovirga sp. MY04]MBB3698520.1 hypothetical protein [Flammeovirga yaeyamensis]NMF34131.1 hypothetical protein [Flammeovirga yaeyamensis]QWG01117.1 hypothetical protein KMW28_15840 [Flammeovirga yaeyamensis]
MGVFIVIFAFAAAIGLGVFLNLNSKKSQPIIPAVNTLTDADVIALAKKNHEGISVAALCLQAKVSAKEARNKLEELRQEGILYLNVDEEGNEKFKISDTSLLD